MRWLSITIHNHRNAVYVPAGGDLAWSIARPPPLDIAPEYTPHCRRDFWTICRSSSSPSFASRNNGHLLQETAVLDSHCRLYPTLALIQRCLYLTTCYRRECSNDDLPPKLGPVIMRVLSAPSYLLRQPAPVSGIPESCGAALCCNLGATLPQWLRPRRSCRTSVRSSTSP